MNLPTRSHSSGGWREPLYKGSPKARKLASLVAVMERINIKRNAVAHAGEFCNVDEADAVIADRRTFVEGLVALYHPDFRTEGAQIRA